MSDKSSYETVRILTASDKCVRAESLMARAGAGAMPAICLEEIRKVLNNNTPINKTRPMAMTRSAYFIRKESVRLYKVPCKIKNILHFSKKLAQLRGLVSCIFWAV